MKIFPKTPGNKRLALASLALFAIGGIPAANAEVLSPFQASYQVERGNLILGEADFSLGPWSEVPNCYRYHGRAVPRPILRFIVGDISDDSYFCSSDAGNIQTQEFRHFEQGDEEDSHTLAFDWPAQKVTYTGAKADDGVLTMHLPDNAVDPFNLHIAARLWLAQMADAQQPARREFAIVDEDEIKHYTLASTPGGTIKTPVGSFETIKVMRVDDPKKKLILWVAPALDFLPIKVESKKRDDPVIRMTIQSLHRGAKTAAN